MNNQNLAAALRQPKGVVDDAGIYRLDGRIDPYLSRWTSGNTSGQVAPNEQVGGFAPGSELPRSNVYQKDFWRDQGFTGKPYEQGQGEYAYDSMGATPELNAWAQQNGYTPGYTEGYGGVLKNGQIVPGSAVGNLTNDDATFYAGMLGIGAFGAAAAGLGAGGGAGAAEAGGAAGGLSSADLGALYGADGYGAGMTGAETAAYGSGSGGLSTSLSGYDLPQEFGGFQNAGAQNALEAPATSFDTPSLYEGGGGGGGGGGGWLPGFTNGQTAGLGLSLAGLLKKPPAAPATPDYTGAANAQAASGRVNQTTPYGSLTYSQNGVDAQGNPIWNQDVKLSPVQQQLLDAQNSTSLGLSNLQGKGLASVSKLFDNLPSASQLPPSAVNPGQTGQDAIMSRVAPQLQMQQDRLNNQLANQGLAPGSEAWNNSQRQQQYAANDMTQQAALHGIDVSNQARQQGMNEQGFYSQMPINLLNAVRTGSQVQNPTFGSTPQGPNLLGAAQLQGQGNLNQYNARTGNYNSQLSGLFGLGSSWLAKPGG